MLLCSNFSSNLISGFAKIANLSNGIFKGETRMQPHAMKVQQNGHKRHATIPSQKSENSKDTVNFFSHAQLPYRPCDLISG